MEEHFLELKAQIEQIYSVLIKQEHDKMPFQGIQIAKTISKIPFFKKYFDTTSQQFINLCINQDAIQFQQGVNIYQKQYQKGLQRYIYIILDGEIQLKESLIKHKTLKVFHIFGQVQIVFKLKNRLQEAIVKKKVKLMRIKESSFLKIFTKKQQIQKCHHYLNVNQYFQSLNNLQKMHLALCLLKQHYQKGQIIKKQGQIFDKVMFFIYGKIEVITKLNMDGKQQDCVIDKLEQMSTFGEYQSTNKTTTDIKLKSVVSGAYYYMKYAQLQRQEHAILQIIQKHSISYPNIKTKVRKQQNKIMKKYYK